MARKPPLTEAQQKRIDELRDKLGKVRKLSDDEYKEALQEILAHGTTMLQMRVVAGNTQGTGACINILEKAHWLLDSLRNRDQKPGDDPYTVNVFFKSSGDKQS